METHSLMRRVRGVCEFKHYYVHHIISWVPEKNINTLKNVDCSESMFLEFRTHLEIVFPLKNNLYTVLET